MQEKVIKFPWMGVLLILLGSALLLEKIHVLHFGFVRVLWVGVMVYGAVHVANGFSTNVRGKIFWGTLLFLYGLYVLLRTFDFIEFRSHPFWPATFIIVGAGFLMIYLNNIREWFSLILALGLMGLGSAVMMGRLEYFDVHDLLYLMRRYWPVVLILMGFLILFKKRGSPRGAT